MTKTQNSNARRLNANAIINKIVPIDAIDPHPRNYNQHPDEQLNMLAESHSEFGQYRSVVVWARPNGRYTQVAGHGYLQGAKKEGLAEVRCDVLPEDTPNETIEAIMVADNEHAKHSVQDELMLAQLLQEQLDGGFSLTSLGSDEESLRQMLQALGDDYLSGGGDHDGDGGDDYDITPEDGPTRSHIGDIWQLGKNRLFVGDCTNIDNVKHLMAGGLADCCWTDPPYGVSYVGKTKDALTIKNDGKEELDSFLNRAFAATDTALQPGAAIYVAHPAGALSVTFGIRFMGQGWRLHETLVWVKDSMVLGHSDYHYKHEPILFGYKPGAGKHGRGGDGWYGDNSQVSVFEVPRPKRSEDHPTMKPLELIQAMLLNSCPPGGLVYEPFGGSGSTLIAAHRMHMRCNIFELDPRYADVILRRFEEETGIESVLIENQDLEVPNE